MYPASKPLIGPQATKEAFLRWASEARMIHFAGHAASSPGTPLDSSLVLAGQGEGGRLTVVEIERARLRGVELVVLAGCDTADGDVVVEEGAVHLARAFLAAGVPSVVAGLWSVDDEATSRLFVEFHRASQKGASPTAALRAAQLRALQDSDPRIRLSGVWASFVVVGGS
jgi:CHAT domain-containing protein